MGLGAAQTTAITPANIDVCSSPTYYVWPPCWGLDRESWQAAGKLPEIPSSLIAAPGAPSNLTTLPDATGQTGQDLSNAAMGATQSNVQDFVNSLSDNPLGSAPCSWLNLPCTWWGIIAAGLIVIPMYVNWATPKQGYQR